MTADNALSNAERILADYGRTLANNQLSGYGMPISLLPYSKDSIKDAIQLVLTTLGQTEPQVHEGLIHGYVYLAQFIPDEDARLVDRSYAVMTKEQLNNEELEEVQQAAKIINSIKAEMENLMTDISLLVS